MIIFLWWRREMGPAGAEAITPTDLTSARPGHHLRRTDETL